MIGREQVMLYLPHVSVRQVFFSPVTLQAFHFERKKERKLESATASTVSFCVLLQNNSNNFFFFNPLFPFPLVAHRGREREPHEPLGCTPLVVILHHKEPVLIRASMSVGKS